MKNILVYVGVICLFALLPACKKSDDKKSTKTTYMTAVINGQGFTAVVTTSAISGTRLTLSGGASGGYPSIVLAPGLYNGAGYYDLGLSANYGSVDSAFGVSNQIRYGNLTISATTPNIVGTFDFTCFDSTKVTNGTFSIEAP